MISRMERVEILALLDIVPDLVAFLQEQGVVHIEEVPLVVDGAPRALKRVHLSSEEKAEVENLTELHRMLHEIAPLLAGRPKPEAVSVAAGQIRGQSLEEWRRLARSWSREMRSHARRKANVHDNIELLAGYRQMLQSVAPLLGRREVILGRGARAVVLKGEVGRAGAQLERRLKRVAGANCEFFHQRMDRNTLVGITVYPEERDRAVERMLHEEGIARIEMPDKELQHIPLTELIPRIDAALEKYRINLTEAEEELAEFSRQTGAKLTAILLAVSDRLAQLKVIGQLARTELAAVLHGWVPAADVEGLKQALAVRFPGLVYLGALPIGRVDQKRIPIQLENPNALEPFEVLLALLKPPTYGSIDPSALVGVFFIFFYGFILGDVAYGLAVIGLAMLFRHKFGRHEAVRSVAAVAIYAGISAIVFGVLFGEFCGNLGEKLFHMTPLWFHRGHDTITLLKAALVIGVVHISLGMILAVRGSLRSGHFYHAMEQLGMFSGLLGIGTIAVGVITGLPMTPVILIAVVLLVACLGLLIYGAGAMAAVQIFEVISLVSNVLSYSRLMALGVASVALADVANRLGEMVGNPIFGIPVAFSIHLLNLAIGMFSPTLHSLRLNYVEFLPKFYSPEGRKYQPFKKEAIT